MYTHTLYDIAVKHLPQVHLACVTQQSLPNITFGKLQVFRKHTVPWLDQGSGLISVGWQCTGCTVILASTN